MTADQLKHFIRLGINKYLSDGVKPVAVILAQELESVIDNLIVSGELQTFAELAPKPGGTVTRLGGVRVQYTKKLKGLRCLWLVHPKKAEEQ